MLFAYDYNDNRVHIDETHSNQEYYCPYCGAPLITRKGDIRQHHFAHKSNSPCSDSWVSDRTYDLSPWHNEWQSLFPKENQEVKLALGETKHRADVMIDRTVIEFQHSIMPVSAFDNRNNFYFNLGHKVIWLFDVSDLWEKGHMSYRACDGGLAFDWKNPKKAFNNYDIQSGCIDLFFQLNDGPERCIVRVMEVSEYGFEHFFTTELMSKEDFLTYVGLKGGGCLPPCREDEEENRRFCAFKEKYRIELNKQQERALLAVEGSNLLLAVPGSGKTTVLVARLGHMVINKQIPPESILAVTYGKNADAEMRTRFSEKFGKGIGDRIDFRTINSLSYKIYSDYCNAYSKKIRPQPSEGSRRRLLCEIFKKSYGKTASENDYLELSAAITYIKNMMLTDEQIVEIEKEYPHLNTMYQAYEAYLDQNGLMDFDDQMVFAHAILTKRECVAEEWRARYRYICVDEAQDTSKIQHEIIRLLAQGNSLFMVGDEDQSIYGYRAAYPKALLNFRYRYQNPYILRMERNYRSTSQIVEKAQAFISQNKGRYEKHMTAERGDGQAVRLEQVPSREAQYRRLLDIARNAQTETAFLYRDNESAIVLIDLLLRNGIPYKHRKSEMNFFQTRTVREVVAYLTLAINGNDTAAFEQIWNKGLLKLSKQQKDQVVQLCKSEGISVLDAIMRHGDGRKPSQKNKNQRFCDGIKRAATATPAQAISLMMEAEYEMHLEGNPSALGKIELLRMLAEQESDIKSFLMRLKELERHMLSGSSPNEYKVILSTIHSSKGLEYDSVYMVDVYDGRFPSSRFNIFSRSKDNADGEMEERRLFYVGITRAMNSLQLFDIGNRPSVFIRELFPEETAHKREEVEQRIRPNRAVSPVSPQTMRETAVHAYRTHEGYPEAMIGMKLRHCVYGEMTVVGVENRPGKTIIKVKDRDEKISQKTWEVLLDNKMITIL